MCLSGPVFGAAPCLKRRARTKRMVSLRGIATPVPSMTMDALHPGFTATPVHPRSLKSLLHVAHALE